MTVRRLFVVLLAVAASCSGRDAPPTTTTRAAATTPRADASAVGRADGGTPGLRLPAGVAPLAYELRLELDPARDAFRGHVVIRARLDAPTDRIWLHAHELAITGGRYRAGARRGTLAQVATNAHEMIALGLDARVPAGEITLELDYTGQVRAEPEGLFRQRFGAQWFLYSQGEATFARTIVPCFDEPRFKVPWRVTAVVPAGHHALGNAPVAHEHALSDGRREVQFAELALPSYLVAIAVGPFAIVDGGTVGSRRVPLRIAVADGDAAHVRAALAWTPQLVAQLEAYFAMPLPWSKLDLVAVPRFFGAMENPGLVTFDVGALVGDPGDAVFLGRHVRFLAHELAHQWLGNAVTPAWWDDLWLSEAFATWLDDKLARHGDAALRGQLARAHALDADHAPDARPLRRPLASNDDIEDAFDAIAYEKGAAVIAMFEAFVGERRFRDAMRAFVRGHAGRTATADDFLAALAGATDPATARAFAGYLARPGAPVVDVALACAGSATLTVTPRGGATVPVCIRAPAATGGARTCTLATGASRIALPSCPAWVIGNADGRGYYHVHATTPLGVPPAPTAAERLADGDDRAAAFDRGELAPAGAVAAIRAALATGDPYAALAATAIARALDRAIVDDATRARWHAWLAARFAPWLRRSPVWAPRTPIERAVRDAIVAVVPGERFEPAAIAAARTRVARALATPPAVPADELEVAIALAAPAGGAALFDKIVAAAARRAEWLAALAAFGPALAPRAVALATDRRFAADAAFAGVAGMLARPPTRAAAWRALRPQLPAILARVEAPIEVIEATAQLCAPAARAEVAAAFAPHVAGIAGGAAALATALAAIDRCVARAATTGDLAAAL